MKKTGGGEKGQGNTKREVPQLCKPLQFSLECLSLGLNPHGPLPHCFKFKFLHSATPGPPLLPLNARHTPRGIQNALTPNQWETVKKAKRKKKEEREKNPPQQHNLDVLTRGGVKRKEKKRGDGGFQGGMENTTQRQDTQTATKLKINTVETVPFSWEHNQLH